MDVDSRIVAIEAEIRELRNDLKDATGARETLLIGSIERAEIRLNGLYEERRQQNTQPAGNLSCISLISPSCTYIMNHPSPP